MLPPSARVSFGKAVIPMGPLTPFRGREYGGTAKYAPVAKSRRIRGQLAGGLGVPRRIALMQRGKALGMKLRDVPAPFWTPIGHTRRKTTARRLTL